MDSVNALLAGIRLGIPFHELMVLINQPIIKQELEKHANSNSLIIDLKNSLSTLATLNKFDLSSIYSEDITVDKLDTLFNPKGISSRPIIKEDLVALNKFIELASIGEELFKIQLNTKFDTSNQFGPELLDNQVKLQKLQSLYQNLLTNSYFSNFEDVVPEVIYNNITQEWTIKPSKLLLNDSYIKIMIDQLNHFKSSFSFLQGPFVNMQKTLNEIVNTGKAFSTYEIKKINGEIYNAVAQKTLDNIADIITNVPTEWGNIRYNIKDKYKPFIEALTREIVFGKPVLKMFDNTIIGNTLSEKYKDIFEDMLGDPDTKVFAERLATYAYFTSGFKYTPQGFSRFVPNTFLTENPQGKKIRDLYNNFNIADSKLTDYELATLILFNNPTLAKRVTLKDDTSTIVNKVIPGYGSLPSSFTISPDSTFKYTDKEGNPIQYLSHTAYITVGGKDLKFEMLFERTGSIEGYYSAINLPGNSSIFSNYSQVDLGFYPDVAPDIIEINNEDISDKDDLEYTDYTEVTDELKQLHAGTKQLTTGNETMSVKDVENTNKIYSIDQYKITLQPNGQMFFKNGEEVLDEIIQNKVLVDDGIITGTVKMAVFNKQKYFILESGKVVSSTGKTVEEGAHKENILKQEIKPCKLG
jgi:hypothetical protein